MAESWPRGIRGRRRRRVEQPEYQRDAMAESWASPVCVATWFALRELERPATVKQVAASLGWFPRQTEPALARLRRARFVTYEAAGRTWSVIRDIRPSLQVYRGTRERKP